MLKLILVDMYGCTMETQFLHGRGAMVYGKSILKSNPNCVSLKLINIMTNETLYTWR
jgi:hypothetical protein